MFYEFYVIHMKIAIMCWSSKFDGNNNNNNNTNHNDDNNNNNYYLLKLFFHSVAVDLTLVPNKNKYTWTKQ